VTQRQDLDVLGCVGPGANQLSMRASIRYATRKATTGDHAAGADDGEREVGPLTAILLVKGRVRVLGTHTVPEGGPRMSNHPGLPGGRTRTPHRDHDQQHPRLRDRKRLTNLPALREVGLSASRRLLGVQRLSHNPIRAADAFTAVHEPITTGTGQRIAGLRWGDRSAHALLQALLVFRLLAQVTSYPQVTRY
jgi:hypothetical protein